MNILKIMIVRGFGPDKICFEVDKPNGCYPFDGNATVEMKVASGTAEEYLKKNFPGRVANMIDVQRTAPDFSEGTISSHFAGKT